MKLTEILINNPITRNLIKKCSSICSHCKTDTIENALFNRAGCVFCNPYARVFSFFLQICTRTFGLDKNNLHDFFSEELHLRALRNVLWGLSEYNFRRPFVTSFPFMVVWDITYKCNLRCLHCYSHDNDQKKEMDTQSAKKIINYFSKNGLLYIAFAGGEPLMREDIFEIIEYASSLGIFTSLATNGMYLTKEVAKKLKNANLWYAEISLDGLKETHESIRGLNTFEKVIDGIKNSVSAGIGTGIATTVTKMNIDEIPKIVSLTQEVKAARNVFFNFIPTGAAKNQEWDLSKEQLDDFLEYVYTLMCNNVNAVSTAPQFARVGFLHCKASGGLNPAVIAHFSHGKMLQDRLSDKNLELLEFIGGCGAGRLYASLRPNGDIQPCVFMPIRLGNILIDDFKNIWRHNETLLSLRNRDTLTGACGVCKYKFVCGGCRAKAYAYSGDVLKEDPSCIYSKNDL